MDRLTEFRKDLNRYEYKQDEKGYCWISEGQIVKKLGQFEDIFELIEKMYKYPVFWKANNGEEYFDFYEDSIILYNPKTNEIDVYEYGFIASYKVEDYGKTWWLKEVDDNENAN